MSSGAIIVCHFTCVEADTGVQTPGHGRNFDIGLVKLFRGLGIRTEKRLKGWISLFLVFLGTVLL
jgi:hypothetical protein